LGELYTDTGQKEKALEHLKKAEERFQEMGEIKLIAGITYGTWSIEL